MLTMPAATEIPAIVIRDIDGGTELRAVEELHAVDISLHSLLQELEKAEARYVRFGSAWWTKRRASMPARSPTRAT